MREGNGAGRKAVDFNFNSKAQRGYGKIGEGGKIMAFKAVSGNALDIKKEKDKHYVGHYVGKQDIVTKIGPQVIWKFVDETGQPFGIYGFTNLDRCMNSIAVNALCRITYQGTANVKTKFGMKDVHQVLVEVDDEGAEEPIEPEPE